jgi:hypothetical protein
MLRKWVLLLLLLNGGYFAWGQGWLMSFGLGPVTQREPQRLTQQIQPGLIELLSTREAELLAAAPVGQRSVQCFQAGLFDTAQSNALRRVLDSALPDGVWALEEVSTPARWIIYMGKYVNMAELEKKRAQLASLRLNFEPLTDPNLMPGLSLGVFNSQAAAISAREALSRRGVRTARVLQEQAALSGWRLRLPSVDETLQKQLAPLKAALAGKTLEPC